MKLYKEAAAPVYNETITTLKAAMVNHPTWRGCVSVVHHPMTQDMSAKLPFKLSHTDLDGMQPHMNCHLGEAWRFGAQATPCLFMVSKIISSRTPSIRTPTPARNILVFEWKKKIGRFPLPKQTVHLE